ncbi:MAG: hypothetical protein ACREQ5_18855, partial [Candidatus Dormibacteria bacterium]
MRIRSVKRIDDKRNYFDITVEDTHNFVLESGSVVHNCGTGVGFSIESRYTNKLPEIPEEMHDSDTMIAFKDSRVGWASGYREFLSLLYSGKMPKWDVSKLRPAGERLKTFGGRSSGPEPLVDLMKYTIAVFQKAKGRKLTTLECHDLVCKIADVVVSGGVRRSALISLSDLNDDHMRLAKFGEWWNNNSHRALSNNSAVYEQKPTMGIFMKEWTSLFESQSGERGIFSRKASQKQAAKSGRRKAEMDFGTNPCCEIILRPYQFCNLSEVVVRAEDTLKSLKDKIRLATILGTLQSTLSDFRYLNKRWKINTEEERLLGVSLTGIMDNTTLADPVAAKHWLTEMREHAVATNKEYAEYLNIEPSVAVTCIKPSGCVGLDTVIRTNIGLMSMRDVFVYYQADPYDSNQGDWIQTDGDLM